MERDTRYGGLDRTGMVAAVTRIADGFGVPLRLDEPLGRHTTMGVGGPAPCFLQPSSAVALAGVMRELREAGIVFRILGAGSNLIVDDAGVKTPVISTSELTGQAARQGDCVQAPAGMLLPRLVRVMAGHGLGGFEFLEGIPGSVGGALFMNAGAGGRWIGDVTHECEVITPEGRLETARIGKEDFGYRSSFVGRRGLVVASALLRGEPDDPGKIQERIRDNRAYRVATQPLSERSCGCIFKNPEGEAAGALLERLSLKSLSVGGAFVSSRHANFIVNRGGTSDDILRLIDRLRDEVRKRAGMDLDLEVILWSDR